MLFSINTKPTWHHTTNRNTLQIHSHTTHSLKSGSTWSLHKHYSPYGGLVLKLKSVISRVLNLILDCYSWVSHYWFLKKTLFFLSGFSNLFNLSFVTFHHFIYHGKVQLASFTIYLRTIIHGPIFVGVTLAPSTCVSRHPYHQLHHIFTILL